MERTGASGSAALVTGAGRGVGAAVARALAAAGAPVAVLDRDAARARAVAAELGGPGRAVACPADVFDGDAVEDAVERAERELGPIGVLVNVAGILRPGVAGPAVLCEDDWADTFAVRASGVFLVSRAVARRMVPRRSGSIVTVAPDIAADPAAGDPRARMSVHAACRAAAVQFTRCLGTELAAYGVRCEVISPGFTDAALASATRLRGVA